MLFFKFNKTINFFFINFAKLSNRPGVYLTAEPLPGRHRVSKVTEFFKPFQVFLSRELKFFAKYKIEQKRNKSRANEHFFMIDQSTFMVLTLFQRIVANNLIASEFCTTCIWFISFCWFILITAPELTFVQVIANTSPSWLIHTFWILLNVCFFHVKNRDLKWRLKFFVYSAIKSFFPSLLFINQIALQNQIVLHWVFLKIFEN